jgi:hypothetical protein
VKQTEEKDGPGDPNVPTKLDMEYGMMKMKMERAVTFKN